MSMHEMWLTVGKIVNTHGIRGELKVVPSTDFPEERFGKGSTLSVYHAERMMTKDVTVESARHHKGTYIIKLAGLDHIQDVEAFKGGQLKVRKEQLAALPEDEYYYYEIIGCTVVTETGETLGIISEILSPGANDVWVVKREVGKPVLLPVIDEVILSVDIANKQVTVQLMEGLME